MNDELYNQAKIQAKAEFRTVPAQIEFWARIGRTAMNNPDLSIDMVEKLLIAKNEENQPFEFTNQ
ncbi:hypothetical protein SPONN_2698 [uncultured Candidatus Thioglobus sp.]|nr:hypothetical protein SPONN_2698 [uncultured Candidatus Thioglobus sp.]SMM99704.1 hypothetical protein SPONL_855 [uncultured Candidatus Thioglobus sp.]